MSTAKIREALETALMAIAPTLPTSLENKSFQPPAASEPYQIVNILFANPDNPEYGARYTELGFMQVKLMFPRQYGTEAIDARALLIREVFKRGTTLVNDDVKVSILKTPEICPGSEEAGKWAVPIKIRFFS